MKALNLMLPDVKKVLYHPALPAVELVGVSFFNPVQIAQSGQCFRAEIERGNWATRFTAYGHTVRVTQGEDGHVWLWCSEQDFNDLWCDYFDLRDSYLNICSTIKKVCGKDSHELMSSTFGNGIRILRQEPFETLISFMLSSANNIPRITSLVNRLCETYGEPIEGTNLYSFPTVERLQQSSEQELRSLGMGFRAKYIHQALQNEEVINHVVSWDNLHGARKSFDWNDYNLLDCLPGVGDKVAKCVMLYGMSSLGAYPVDTWMKKVHDHWYDGVEPMWVWPGVNLDGVVQMYLYYYERMAGADESSKEM